MNERPKKGVANSTLQKTLNIFSILMLLSIFIYIFVIWSDLPYKVPSHFNAKGEPDSWSGKGSVLILPIISTILFFMMYFIVRIPHIHNYSVEVKNENASRLYSISSKYLTILNFEIVFFMTVGAYATIQISFGKEGLGTWYLPTLLIVVLGTLAIFIYRLITSRK